ncbi:exodeoxyribonuclease VII small subunit [Tessaracoccus rhinocerotis]|uniref:Exodeoxyribonuclease 7 small subunit n=1 Tax=Tessaracoccus rhinocerotis TaxID=1689449 RepID=A0A553K206_9ACTN|nr:exodeoxyribonuclease VII small subunit [Tessaracoccus rhinocerotis]TRY18715.1 exodeoxyribonuclease VII small subunit [Tessaracoccus rhinocerotis]
MAEELTYEAAREELIEVVRKLESGGAPLADSMALWKRGEELAAICQGHLDAARAVVAKARQEREQQD